MDENSPQVKSLDEIMVEVTKLYGSRIPMWVQGANQDWTLKATCHAHPCELWVEVFENWSASLVYLVDGKIKFCKMFDLQDELDRGGLQAALVATSLMLA